MKNDDRFDNLTILILTVIVVLEAVSAAIDIDWLNCGRIYFFKMKKERINITLDQKHLKWFRIMRLSTGKSTSETIRGLIDEKIADGIKFSPGIQILKAHKNKKGETIIGEVTLESVSLSK